MSAQPIQTQTPTLTFYAWCKLCCWVKLFIFHETEDETELNQKKSEASILHSQSGCKGELKFSK